MTPLQHHLLNTKHGMRGSLFQDPDDKMYIAASAEKDTDGDFIASRWEHTEQEAIDGIMYDSAFFEEMPNLIHVGAIPHTFEPYKVGDKVDVLEIAKELPEYENWCDNKKALVGQKALVIKAVLSEGYRIHEHFYYFPHRVLAPHHEEPQKKPSEDEIAKAREEGYKAGKAKVLEEAVSLADRIELQEQDGGMSEWKAFRAFRNALRDKINELEK
jgi:hypothetical protein